MRQAPRNGHPGFPHTARAKRLLMLTMAPLYRAGSTTLQTVGRGCFRVVAALSTQLGWSVSTQVVVGRAMFLMGFVVQVVLVLLLWVMVDLCLDVMTLWVELAAKHLRIVLDPT